MKVWIALNSIRPHEWEIIGVYTTYKAAQEATDGMYGANTVQEWEVDGT